MTVWQSIKDALLRLAGSMKAWTAFLGILTALGMRFGFKVDENLYWSIEGFFALLLGAQALTDHGKAAALANSSFLSGAVATTNDDPDMGGEAKKTTSEPKGFVTVGFAIAIAIIGLLMAISSSCGTANVLKTDATNLGKKIYACAGEEKAVIEKDFNAIAFVIDLTSTIGGVIINGGDVNNVVDALIVKYGPIFGDHTEAVVACVIKDYRSTILGLPSELRPQSARQTFAGVAPSASESLDDLIAKRGWKYAN